MTIVHFYGIVIEFWLEDREWEMGDNNGNALETR